MYSRLGNKPGMQACVCGWDLAVLVSKKLRGRENTEREGLTQHSLQVEDGAKWRIQVESPVRVWQAWVWKVGAACLRFAPVSQSLSQTGEPDTHLWDYGLSTAERSSPGVLC